MNPLKNLVESRPKTFGAILWLMSVALMIACIVFQDKTGPTQPLEGEVETPKGKVRFRFLRSENIGTDLTIMLLEPVPDGVLGFVKYRRYMSHDEWKTMPLAPLETEWSRRGSRGVMKGLGARLPGLMERAGKYEYFVFTAAAGEEPTSITADRAVLARYKGAVPIWVLMASLGLKKRLCEGGGAPGSSPPCPASIAMVMRRDTSGFQARISVRAGFSAGFAISAVFSGLSGVAAMASSGAFSLGASGAASFFSSNAISGSAGCNG